MKESSQNIVFDSSALIALLEGEKKGAQVIDILSKAVAEQTEIYVSVINWGEIMYVAEQKRGQEHRKKLEEAIDKMGLEIADVNRETVNQAIFFKAHYHLDYADSFAASLAFLKKAVLVTGDRDFERIKSQVSVHLL